RRRHRPTALGRPIRMPVPAQLPVRPALHADRGRRPRLHPRRDGRPALPRRRQRPGRLGEELPQGVRPEARPGLGLVARPAGGRRQLLVWHTEAVAGLDPATGKEFWSIDYPVEGDRQRPEVNIAAPRRAGDLLLLSSFYHGSLMLKLAVDKPGATKLWNKAS